MAVFFLLAVAYRIAAAQHVAKLTFMAGLWLTVREAAAFMWWEP